MHLGCPILLLVSPLTVFHILAFPSLDTFAEPWAESETQPSSISNGHSSPSMLPSISSTEEASPSQRASLVNGEIPLFPTEMQSGSDQASSAPSANPSGKTASIPSKIPPVSNEAASSRPSSLLSQSGISVSQAKSSITVEALSSSSSVWGEKDLMAGPEIPSLSKAKASPPSSPASNSTQKTGPVLPSIPERNLLPISSGDASSAPNSTHASSSPSISSGALLPTSRKPSSLEPSQGARPESPSSSSTFITPSPHPSSASRPSLPSLSPSKSLPSLSPSKSLPSVPLPAQSSTTEPSSFQASPTLTTSHFFFPPLFPTTVPRAHSSPNGIQHGTVQSAESEPLVSTSSKADGKSASVSATPFPPLETSPDIPRSSKKMFNIVISVIVIGSVLVLSSAGFGVYKLIDRRQQRSKIRKRLSDQIFAASQQRLVLNPNHRRAGEFGRRGTVMVGKGLGSGGGCWGGAIDQQRREEEEEEGGWRRFTCPSSEDGLVPPSN
ncbi:hypothetical protein CROQUDRAFT_716782 [Cronartium quercuum f. sp. fusiforme G11]|uniref:Uncharacterized protein n=1 Tax=Cronartium quercuum f. sp. fusiforme G11 TaxID=708437 RepID=A0A9P6NID3_9BASI|nr:hypothetical protein CROQUDRAFT_716782 [Cronartium quercuum f. sp. fusiforme G11]